MFEKLIIDVKVSNLNRAIKFYRDILGLSLINKASDWASFEAFGSEIHLYLYGGIEHSIEFRVSNLFKEVASLKDKGINFFVDKKQPDLLRVVSDEIMEFSWGKMAFFRDSENNRLSLLEDKK